jgi:gliding motility-associated-like protein
LSFQPSPGTTIYTVTGTDINGCTGTDQVMVQVTGLSQPIFEYSGVNCIPATLSLYNTTPNSQNCSWIVSGMGTFSSCDSISVILDQPGCYDVSLTTAVNGCPSTVTVDDLICVDAFPIADFSFEPGTVSTLNTEVEFQNESSNANSFVWDFGDGSSANYLSDPVHVFPDNTFGTYEIILVAMSENGCSDTVTAFISVEEELIYYVPNTFTPDGDMYNQVFEPVFSSGFDPYDYHLMIYDRWGEVVFESFDHQIGWDGTYGAQKASAVFNCPDGTYTWRLEFSALSNDQRFVEVGHVTLLR